MQTYIKKKKDQNTITLLEISIKYNTKYSLIINKMHVRSEHVLIHFQVGLNS